MRADLNPQSFYFSIVFYYVSLSLIKLGLLLQYYPLVAVKHRRLMVFITATISIWSTVVVFMAIAPCQPVSGFWKKDIASVCIPTLPLWYSNAAGNSTYCHTNSVYLIAHLQLLEQKPWSVE